MIEIAGYFATAFIGVSLGLIGAGGSILCVPVMVYLFSIRPVEASSYSLFIVGFSSAAGAIRNYRQRLIQFDIALTMGLSSIAAIIITRALLLPAIPSNLATIGTYTIKKSVASMVLFSIVMLCAAFSMTSNAIPSKEEKKKGNRRNIVKLSTCGAAIGFVAGLTGIGGGFMLIPGLVLFAKLPMKEAVATSLVIITMNCVIAVVTDSTRVSFDWGFLFRVTSFAVTGIFLGIFLSKKFHAPQLKKIFGWLIMIIGSGILIKEILYS